MFAIIDILDITAKIIAQTTEDKKVARKEKKTLIDKLEKVSGEDTFKYMNLISFANMDEFIADARLHAQQSFKMCMFSAIIGFTIICISVGFAFYFQIIGNANLTSSYLGAGAGLIIEAISAIFFALYSRTTSQVNRLHDHLLESQSMYAAILSSSLIPDAGERQRQIMGLSDRMMTRFHTAEKAA
jgi:hypothetical protein